MTEEEDEEGVSVPFWGIVAHLPKDKYAVVETEDGWDILGDTEPSFT